jgi:hypothetical protein
MSVFNLPVIRSGTLASAYQVPFQGKPHFLIDARLHKGTSGSPVITKLKNLLETIGPGKVAGTLRSVLLGVNTSTWALPKDEELDEELDEEPLGLNAVVFGSIVQHITKDSTSKDVSYQETCRNGSIIGFPNSATTKRMK